MRVRRHIVRIITKRCSHCRSPYDYYASGVVHKKYNDGIYCPSCARAISDALAAIPVRFKSVWEETDEMTVEELLEIRKEKLEEEQRNYPDRIIGEIVFPTMYDLTDSENYSCRYLVIHKGRAYRVDTWTKTPEKNKVVVYMDVDLQTGKKTYGRY